MLRVEHLLVQLLRTFLGCLSASYRIRQNIRAGKLSRLQGKTTFAGKVSRFLCGREGLATRDYVHCYCKNIHGKTFAEG